MEEISLPETNKLILPRTSKYLSSWLWSNLSANKCIMMQYMKCGFYSMAFSGPEYSDQITGKEFLGVPAICCVKYLIFGRIYGRVVENSKEYGRTLLCFKRTTVAKSWKLHIGFSMKKDTMPLLWRISRIAAV